MDYKTSLRKHMTELCENIGARPTGSAANKNAAEYAFKTLQKSGFKVRRQEFECIDWESFGATLLIGGRDIPVEPAEYALSCEVQAPFVCLGSVDALRSAELKGKVAVLYGDLCNEPLMPKNFEFWNPYEHKQIIALLEEKAPAAIIAVSSLHEHIIQDGDFDIPCAVVSETMLEAFFVSAGSTAELSINTKRTPVKAYNIIGVLGTGREKVCFSAHIDTKPATPGALDNASGVSVLLAFAETLAETAPSFQIEIVLLNGEDYYSNPGEITYMRGLKPGYTMAVNIDGVGLVDSATSVSFYECGTGLEGRVMERVDKTVGMEQIEPWPMGDHMIFASCGIPTIAITASNIFQLLDTVIHSQNDDMKKIDFDVLERTVAFLHECLEAAQGG